MARRPQVDIHAAIQELRAVNQHVPDPPRLPTEEEVAAAEAETGIAFHPDYRQFLLTASDVVLGTLEPASVVPGSGHLYLPPLARAAWDMMHVPKHLLPICEDNGDYFCMTQSGSITFWSHDGMFAPETWPDLATWIKEVWIGEGRAI
jgi:hypothetical protein